MFKRILVGVDGSEHAYKAAKVAGDLARHLQADLWIVASFEEVPRWLGDASIQEAITERVRQANEILGHAREIIGEIPGTLTTEVLEGPPAEAILTVADAHHADLIVMGTRGLGRLAGLLLGSQSQKVAAHAKCPVLLVR